MMSNSSSNSEPIKCKVHFLHGNNLNAKEAFTTTIIEEYRKQVGWKKSVLTSEDALIAFQIVAVAKTKDDNMDLSSDVLYVIQCVFDHVLKGSKLDETAAAIYEAYKEFLKHSNCIDFLQIVHELRNYVMNGEEIVINLSLHSAGDFEAECWKYLSQTDWNFYNEDSEQISCSDSLLLLKKGSNITSSPQHRNVKNSQIREVFSAWMEMLVNSRHELALSRCLQLLGVDRDAFVHVRHVAKQRNLPMAQLVISQIQRRRMGGNLYKPPADCPLAAHIKSLSLFVDQLNLLHNILEETTNPLLAVKKLLRCIKQHLLKHACIPISNERLGSVMDELLDSATSILSKDTDIEITPGKTAAVGGSIQGRKALRLLQRMLDLQVTGAPPLSCASYVTSGVTCSQGTPKTLPTLGETFKTPDAADESLIENQPLSARISASTQPDNSSPARASFCWGRYGKSPAHRAAIGPKEAQQSIEDFVTNSVTIAQAARWRAEADTITEEVQRRVQEKRRSTKEVQRRVQEKRRSDCLVSQTDKQNAAREPLSQLQQTDNGPPAKLTKRSSKQNKPKARRKLLTAQVKGQTALTKFFSTS